MLADQARHCWTWCGGWAPERWPLYETFYPVADWLQLVELMEHIRVQQSKN